MVGYEGYTSPAGVMFPCSDTDQTPPISGSENAAGLGVVPKEEQY